MINTQQTQTTITNDHGEEQIHVFDAISIEAINAALSISRPLLIRGEPGIGKSQLAKAAAEVLNRTYIPFVINAKTEANDLLWSFDAVARLADAQIEGALCKNAKQRELVKKQLAVSHYIKPEPLWAALNWNSAQQQYKTYNQHKRNTINPLNHYHHHQQAETEGVVLLIDEIDKADSSVPNGLLEVLGANRFHPQGMEQAIEVKQTPKPLIIITTNEERILPDAFIRRCLSITFKWPKTHKEQMAYLVERAAPNFPELDTALTTKKDNKDSAPTLLQVAAEMVLKDRQQAKQQNLHPLPGQAEYFDLLRGIKAQMAHQSREQVIEIVEKLSRFTSKKHPDFPEQ